MSTSIVNDRSTSRWIKFGGATALMFLACWGGAITYWRTTGRNPATADLVILMFGLPLTLLLAFLVGHKLIGQRKAAHNAAASSSPVTANQSPSRLPSLAILAASVRLPHGTSPEELAEAIAKNKTRADLDKELLDDDGFPILSVRSSEAHDESLQEEVTLWLAAKGMVELSFSEEQWRALTLATAVAGEIAGQAASLLLPQAQQLPPRLTLVPILPVEWETAQRQAVVGWLGHLAAQCGWPAEHIALADAFANTEQPSKILNLLAEQMAAATEPSIALVVACGSAIGEQTVSRWAADGALFTSSHSRGRIPGEGAVALLIMDAHRASSIDGAVFALLDAIEEACRVTSIDETRRTDPALLNSVVERALQRGGIAPADVGMVIADTGQRANRVGELMGHLSTAMPQLDDQEDVLRVGAACGSCDAVPFVTALALARHYAIEKRVNVLCVSNEDPFQRAVGVVRAAA